MADILILMRHAKAERATEGKLDIERRLTEAGKRSLAATLPHSLGLMPADGRAIQVWSSPAARAQQTAQLLQRALKRRGANVDPDIRMADVLWTQDGGAFLADARACEADIVAAVGHNPFIEDLTAQLTGSQVVFATGALAAIALDGEQCDVPGTAPGRLLWFAQGPVSQRWKSLVQMERILSQAANAVQERLGAFLAHPDDIEAMHKFRVSIRTLRSLVAFVSPWQSPEQGKRVQDYLKSAVAETSRLRELDVLSEQAQAMEGASGEFIEFCAGAAAAERKRVLKALSSKKTAKLLERVASEMSDVKWRKRVIACGLAQGEVRGRFDGLVAELRQELAVLDLADVEKTHEVRKGAKRVRYDAEKFKPLLGDDAVEIAKGMTAHQDDLGAICDARVNIDIINAFPTDDLPEPVTWDLALLRAQNETYLYTTLRKETTP